MEAKRGDRVSINVNKRHYFFQDGEGGINLSEGVKEMDIIPMNATEHHLAQINHALKAGGLILGHPETKVENITDDDADIKEVIKLGRNKLEKWVRDLVADKRITGQKKSYKLETLLAMERADKNRVGVTLVLEQQLRYVGGVSRIEEGEQEKLVIKLTSGNEEEAEKQ
jgi:hypothetical protein